MPEDKMIERPQRRRRKEARPAEIIEAGMAEFAEKGFAGARLSDVATRAGIAKGTIYLYFESKEKLFEAVVETKIRSTITEVETMIAGYQGSSDTLLHIIISKLYQEMVLSDKSELMRIIIGEGRRFPEVAKFYYDTVIKNGMEVMTALVQRGIDRGEFRQSAAAEYPRLIMAPAVMATIWRLTFNEFEEIDTDMVMAAHLDLVLNGLKTGRGDQPGG